MGSYNVYHEVTVKIEYRGGFGSGCLYNPPDTDYTYIFTAKHCFADYSNIVDDEIIVDNIIKEEICLQEINVCRHKTRSIWDNAFEILDIYLAEGEIDLALIKIRRVKIEKNIKLMNVKALEKYEVSIFGYPERLFENKTHPTQEVSGKILNTFDDQIEFEISNLDTFDSDAKNALNSFSGSGIFRDISNEVYLIGIYTKVKDIQVSYGSLVGECLYNIHSIIDSNSLDKLDIFFEEEQINYCGRYLSLDKWESKNLTQLSKWVDIKSSTDIIGQVLNHFNSGETENILYIVGESGTGKTRAVLQACKSSKAFEKVMCFERYSNIDSNIIDTLKRNNIDKFYLVVDDVTPEEWELINRELINRKNIRVVLIGVVPEAKRAYKSGIYYKEPPNEEEIKLILNRNAESLTEEAIKSIINLSESDLRLVLLIKDVLVREKEISLLDTNRFANGFISLGSIFNRIIDQYSIHFSDINTFKKVYSKLCILLDIGFKGQHKHEIEILTNFFELNNDDVNIVIDEATKCSLGQEKYEFFEPYPRVLARYIFENMSWPAIRNRLEAFMSNLTEVMQKRFINRVEECSASIRGEVEEALASWFRITFNDYDLSLISDIKRAKVFSVYAEFSPINGLEWIKTSIKKSLYRSSIINFSDNSSRRYVVWLTEHLACFKENFYLCEEILFLLAQNETENGISNNSIGVWQGLFLITFSNTEIPFIERYQLFLSRIERIPVEGIDIIFGVISSIFNDRVFRIVPPKVVGGRIVPESWNPKYYSEIYDLRNKFVEDLITTVKLLGEYKKDKFIDFFIDKVGVFIQYGQGEKIIRLLIEDLEIDETKLVFLRKSLMTYLSMLKLRNKKEKSVDKDISQVERWLKEIEPKTLEDEFKSFINLDYWRLNDSNGDEPDKLVLDFAGRLLENKFNFKKYTETLENKIKDLTVLNMLMKKLGECDINEYYFTYIHGLIETDKCNSIVLNYIAGRNTGKGILDEKYVKLFDTYKDSYKDSILYFTIMLDPTTEGFNRAVYIINKGISNYNLLYNFRYKEWNDLLTEDNKVILMNCILKSVPKEYSFRVILHLNYMWDRGKVLSDIRAELILKALKEITDRRANIELWEWEENFRMIPQSFIEQKSDILLKAFNSDLGLTFDDQIIELIKELGKDFSTILVPKVGRAFLDRENHKVLIGVYTGLFESFYFEVVKQWVTSEGDEAAIAIARHLISPAPTEDDISNVPVLTEWILEKFESNDRVFSEFICGRHSFESIWVEEKIANHENLVKAMQPYLRHRLKRIREWAQYEIKDSENLIKQTNELKIIQEREER